MGDNYAAVQTVSQAQATTAGELSALWATKAQINGQGGGFGLSVEMSTDGSVMTSFLIDADVFAVLSRATGATSTIHPFIVKNGIVYINKAVLNSADINSLVANYITVTELVGLNIKGSTISGTNIIGGSLNIGDGKAIIDSAGKATLQDAVITGNITATSGSIKNVTIEETCDVKGSIYVENLIGDVTKLTKYSNGFTVSSFPLSRNVVAVRGSINGVVTVSGSGSTTIAVVCYLNGVEVDRAEQSLSFPSGVNQHNVQIPLAPVFEIPAGVTATISFGVIVPAGWIGKDASATGTCTYLIGVQGQ